MKKMITKENTPVADALNRAYEKAISLQEDVFIDWDLERRKFSILKAQNVDFINEHYYVNIDTSMDKKEIETQKSEVLNNLHRYYYE